MYAHRNEKVVNFGPGIEGNHEVETSQDSELKGPAAAVKRKSSNKRLKECNSNARDQKKVKYKLIARFKGMNELEFSKWVISATPSEREKVLRDFKKRKEKKVAEG